MPIVWEIKKDGVVDRRMEPDRRMKYHTMWEDHPPTWEHFRVFQGDSRKMVLALNQRMGPFPDNANIGVIEMQWGIPPLNPVARSPRGRSGAGRGGGRGGATSGGRGNAPPAARSAPIARGSGGAGRGGRGGRGGRTSTTPAEVINGTAASTRRSVSTGAPAASTTVAVVAAGGSGTGRSASARRVATAPAAPAAPAASTNAAVVAAGGSASPRRVARASASTTSAVVSATRSGRARAASAKGAAGRAVGTGVSTSAARGRPAANRNGARVRKAPATNGIITGHSGKQPVWKIERIIERKKWSTHKMKYLIDWGKGVTTWEYFGCFRGKDAKEMAKAFNKKQGPFPDDAILTETEEKHGIAPLNPKKRRAKKAASSTKKPMVTAKAAVKKVGRTSATSVTVAVRASASRKRKITTVYDPSA